MFADIYYGTFLDRKLSRLPGLETLATDARITSDGDVARILTAMGRMGELKERTATPGT